MNRKQQIKRAIEAKKVQHSPIMRKDIKLWEIAPNTKHSIKEQNSSETKKVLDKIDAHLKNNWHRLSWESAQRKGNRIRVEANYRDLHDVLNDGLLRTMSPNQQARIGIRGIS